MSVKAWVIGGVVATVGILGYTGYRKAKKVIGRVGEVLGVSILFDEKVAKFDAAIGAIKDAKSAEAASADLAELKKLGVAGSRKRCVNYQKTRRPLLRASATCAMTLRGSINCVSVFEKIKYTAT